MQTKNLAVWPRQILRLHHPAALANREKDEAVRKHKAGAKMHAAARAKFFIRPVNPFLVDPAVIFDPSAHHRSNAAHFVLARGILATGAIGQAKVHPSVVRIIRMQGHFKQTALSMVNRLGQTFNRQGIQFSLGGNKSQATYLFGHQVPPVGQKRNRPRTLKTLTDQRLNAIIMQLGFDDLVRRRHGKFHALGKRLFFLFAQKNYHAANLFRREHTLPRHHPQLGLALGDRPRDVLV